MTILELRDELNALLEKGVDPNSEVRVEWEDRSASVHGTVLSGFLPTDMVTEEIEVQYRFMGLENNEDLMWRKIKKEEVAKGVLPGERVIYEILADY